MTTRERLPSAVPADAVPGPPQGRWTYPAYAALPPDGQRYEVIAGVLYRAPAPTVAHQDAAGRLFSHLMTHVQLAQRGRVFIAPLDVELTPADVLQPNIVVVLTAPAAIITPTRLIGAPDLVVEIAAPGTAGYDRREKQDAYARAGVAEYWIADPATRTIEVLVLEHDAYRSLGVFVDQATLPARVVPGLPVPVAACFG